MDSKSFERSLNVGSSHGRGVSLPRQPDCSLLHDVHIHQPVLRSFDGFIRWLGRLDKLRYLLVLVMIKARKKLYGVRKNQCLDTSRCGSSDNRRGSDHVAGDSND